MKEEMNMGEILQEMRQIKQREQRTDKIMEIVSYSICLATIFIIVVHFI